MKKAVFIILFALPVFLMITISVAGRLIIKYMPIPVEGIRFEDGDGEELDIFFVGKGQTVSLEAIVLPDLASNKKVHYSAINNYNAEHNFYYIEYNEETNELTGLNYGIAQLVAITDDNRMRTEIDIEVTDKNVRGVELNITSVSKRIGEDFKLNPTIIPSTAENRDVIWTSSHPELVSVRQDGLVMPLAATEEGKPVVITVTTVDGGYTAECHVTVVNEAPVFDFYRNGRPYQTGYDIMAGALEVDLYDYLRIHGELIPEGDSARDNITFIVGVSDNARLEGTKLIFTQREDYITITAKWDNNGEIITSKPARFRY